MNEEQTQQSNIISTSHKFAKNSIYNVMGFIVTFPILILLTPYMLDVLGKARFGVWAIAGVVTSYAQLSDMGMTTAIVKFVAEHWAKEEVERISKVVSTAFFSFAVVGGIVATGILLARHFIVVNLLKVPPEMQSEALFVVSGIVIIFYFNLLFSVYNSVLIGLQRMDVTNIIMTSSKVLRALGMWFFLALGFGLKGLIINGALFSFLTAIINAYWARRLTGRLQVNPLYFSFGELQRVIKYSINIFIASIFSNIAMEPSSKLILARFTSLANVSYFEIGQRIQSLVRTIFQIGILPMLPASSEMKSLGELKSLQRLYFHVTRVIFFLGLPIFLVLIVFARPIISAWLGEGYEMAADAIRIFLIGHFCSLFITPQYIIFQGIGKPHLSSWIAAISAVSNIIGSLILVTYFGYYGSIIGYSASLIIGALGSLLLFERYTNIKIVEIYRQIQLSGIIILILFAGALLIANQFLHEMNLLVIALIVLILFGIYNFILLVLEIVNDDERKLLSLLWNKYILSFLKHRNVEIERSAK